MSKKSFKSGRKYVPKEKVSQTIADAPWSASGLIKGAALLDAFQREQLRCQTRNDEWINEVTGMNLPGRDKQAYMQFIRSPTMTASILDYMFRGDAVTQRIIKIFPEEAIRKGWEVSGDPKGIISDVMKRLGFTEKLTTAAMWARLYGGAVMVLGLNDGNYSDEPLDINNLKSIDYIHVYDRYQAYSWTGTYDFDIYSPNYGNPVRYNVTDPMTSVIYDVHYSRIIRLDGIIMPPRQRLANNGWGESILTSCYTYIRNYCSCLGNIATMFNDMVKNVLSIENLKQMLASNADGVNTRISTLALASNNTNFLVLDSTETLDRKAAQLSGYPELFNMIALGLCAATDIPSVRLFGIEPKGLNASAESSTKNMYDAISSYQQSKLYPAVKQFCKLVMACSDYGFGSEPKQWDVKFNPLEQLTDLDAATVRKTMAEADRIYVETGILLPEEVGISRFGGEDYSLETEIDVNLRNDPTFAQQVIATQVEQMPESERGEDTDNSDES